MNPIAEGMTGSLRAVAWAVVFYVMHAWPLAVLVGVPTLVMIVPIVRGTYSPGGDSTRSVGIVSMLLRVTLFLIVGSIDLSTGAAWWDNLWPGEWATPLSGRVASMSGRVDVWLWMGLGVAIACVVITALVKLLTLPAALRFVFRAFGARPAKAARWADAIGLGAGSMITLPITSLILYAAVARPAYYLRP
jgi:hypothetical protein